MSGKRYSLSGWDLGVVFGALGVLAVLNAVQLLAVPGSAPAPEPTPVEVAEDAALPLRARAMTDDMLWHYKRWDKRNSPVAVFARGKTSFGWVNSYLEVEAARTDALAWCAQKGDDCEVIEVRGDLGIADGIDMPLTPRLLTIVPRVRATPGPVALAVAGTGAYGIGRGKTTAAAVARAQGACAEMTVKDRPDFLPVHPCKVIYQR